MNKKTKMWLGVGVVAVAAYYFYNQSKKKAAAAAAVAPKASMASMTGGVTGDRLIS